MVRRLVSASARPSTHVFLMQPMQDVASLTAGKITRYPAHCTRGVLKIPSHYIKTLTESLDGESMCCTTAGVTLP